MSINEELLIPQNTEAPQFSSNRRYKSVRPPRGRTAMESVDVYQPKFMTIIERPEGNYVELHLNGIFDDVANNSQDLIRLRECSERYGLLVCYINSNGGNASLMIELKTIFSHFETTITCVTSTAMSAGFMLWAMGNIRVVSPSAEMMIHREAWGYQGKTDQILSLAQFNHRRYEKIFKEYVGDILLEEEILLSRTSECWIMGEDLIERGAAVPYDVFRANLVKMTESVTRDSGHLIKDERSGLILHLNGDNARVVGNIETSNFKFSYIDFCLNNKIRVIDDEDNRVNLNDESLDSKILDYIESMAKAEVLVSVEPEIKSEKPRKHRVRATSPNPKPSKKGE